MADVGAKVANALHWDLAIPRYRVTAEVHAGVVTLHGNVERADLRSSAELIVRRVSGVTGVTNKIAVRPAEDLPQSGLPR